MGCELVDAPGQGASNWDNLVANEAYLKSDAILALWDGSKEIGEKTLSMIENITALKDKNALFLGCNQRQSSVATERIFGSSLSRLKNKNIEFSGNNAAIYHARLALHALQLKRIQAGSLTVTPEYRKKLEKHLRRDVEDVLDEDASLENPEAYLAASKLPQLMKNIEAFIYERKGNTLLIAAGANPILQKLKTCKSRLEIELKHLNVSEFELVEKVGIAKNAVATFVQDAQDHLKDMKSMEEATGNTILEPYMKELSNALEFEANAGNGGKITCFVKKLREKLVSFIILTKLNKKKRNAWIEKMTHEAIAESELHLLPKPTLNEFVKTWADDESKLRIQARSFTDVTRSSLEAAWSKAINTSELLPASGFALRTDPDLMDVVDLKIQSATSAAMGGLIVGTALGSGGTMAGTSAIFASLSALPAAIAVAIVAAIIATIVGMILGNFFAETLIRRELKKEWPKIANQMKESVKEALEKILNEHWNAERAHFNQLIEQKSKDLENHSKTLLKNLQQDEAVIANHRRQLHDNIHSIGGLMSRLEQFTKDAEKQFPTRAA
jgi:uncharacterized protein YneF (UPF0154 family)